MTMVEFRDELRSFIDHLVSSRPSQAAIPVSRRATLRPDNRILRAAFTSRL